VIELIALAVFAALTLLTIGVASLVSQNRSSAAKRLMSVTGQSGDTLAAPPDSRDARSTKLSYATQLVEKVGFWASAKHEKDRKGKEEVEDILSMAGWRGPRVLAFYRGTRLLGALIGTAVALAATAATTATIANVNVLSFACLGGLVGYFGPRLYVRWRVNKRQLMIRRSLPDVLDMIVICVEAGLGLNAALERVAQERTRVTKDVMGSELKYMTFELAAGVPRDQAFHNLGGRNGVDDLQALAAFMIQSEKLGASLVEALKIYSEELRMRRKQRAQESANKAAVKLLFPLVFFIFPTMFLIILGPAIMKLSSSMGSILQ